MPGLIANAELYGTFVGETPATGIVKARLIDGTATAVLGYDEATQSAIIHAQNLLAGAATFAGSIDALDGLSVLNGLTVATGPCVIGGDPGGLEKLRSTGGFRFGQGGYANGMALGRKIVESGALYYDTAAGSWGLTMIAGPGALGQFSVFDPTGARRFLGVNAAGTVLTLMDVSGGVLIGPDMGGVERLRVAGSGRLHSGIGVAVAFVLAQQTPSGAEEWSFSMPANDNTLVVKQDGFVRLSMTGLAATFATNVATAGGYYLGTGIALGAFGDVVTLYGTSGRAGAQIASLGAGNRTIFFGDTIEFYDVNGATRCAYFDPATTLSATQTALVLQLNGTGLRLSVKAGNALGAGDKVCVLQ